MGVAETRAIHDTVGAKRGEMLRAARKLIAVCPVCSTRRPLHPKTGRCWPCDHLTEVSWLAATDRQDVPRGEMCNDCAFKPDSPEAQSTPDFVAANIHRKRVGRDESPTCRLDRVVDQAKSGNGIFWCHKPMLEPCQLWGYDAATDTLTPMYMEGQWRPCGGWLRVFDKAWAPKPETDSQ